MPFVSFCSLNDQICGRKRVRTADTWILEAGGGPEFSGAFGSFLSGFSNDLEWNSRGIRQTLFRVCAIRRSLPHDRDIAVSESQDPAAHSEIDQQPQIGAIPETFRKFRETLGIHVPCTNCTGKCSEDRVGNRSDYAFSRSRVIRSSPDWRGRMQSGSGKCFRLLPSNDEKLLGVF